MALSEFQRILTEAVADISANGYDSAARLEDWLLRLRIAAERDGVSDADVAEALKRTLGTTYKRLVDNGGLARSQGVSRFTIERVRPELRAELDRRILASANLIKLNREQMVDKTLQRFSGWATSVPPGGSRVVDKRAVKKTVRKALASEPFEVRRVFIDQSAKLAANLNMVLAEGSGAIAVQWSSRWREAGYNYRPDHKARDGHVYALRGNWALERGLMKPGPDGYYDQITAVGEEPFCRCSAVFLHNIEDLPDDMITKKGRAELTRVRGLIAAE